MGHSQDDLLPTSRKVGQYQVLLSGDYEEPVLPSETASIPKRNSSLRKTSSSLGKSYGQGLAKANSDTLQVQDQSRVIKDDLPDCLGKEEHCVVAESHARGVCPLPLLSSNLEEHTPRNRCLRCNMGGCACRQGGYRRVEQDGGETHHRPQGMDGVRAHGQEEHYLPVRQVGHVACRQPKCQTCIFEPRYSQRHLAVQESCGSAPPPSRAPDSCGPCIRQVSTSPACRLSQQEKEDSRLAHGQPTGSETVSTMWSATNRSDGHSSVSPAASLLFSHVGRDGLGGGQLSPGLGQVQSELCVSTSGNGGINTEQNSSMPIINEIPVNNTVETTSNLVSEGSASIIVSSSQISCQSQDSAGSVSVILSSKHALWQSDEVRRVEAFWRGRNKSGRLSPGAESIILSGWAQGTKSVYGLGYRYYTQFCKKHQLDPFIPDPVNLLNFLTHCFEVKKCQYRTLNCYRSAVSSTLSHDPSTGQPVGMDPLISRFFKGVRRLRPPRMKLFPNWSIATVLTFLKSYGDSRSLSLSQLLIKTCFLVSLVCCKRPACLRNMKKVPGYWELTMAGLRCQTLGISKTELHHISTPIEIKPFSEDPQLCPVYHMVRLDKILDKVRPEGITDFWLSSRRPHKPVSTQTICKWLKQVIVESGALSGSARDVRSVGSSTAAQAGLDIGRIMQAADWRRVKTFQSHYFKPQPIESISNILRVAN